jgi:hypothetical protein
MTSFECYKCFYKTNKKNNIIYHFNRKNKCIRANNCSYTDNEILLLNDKQLNNIENMGNIDNKKILCSYCNKNFSHLSNLNKHMKKFHVNINIENINIDNITNTCNNINITNIIVNITKPIPFDEDWNLSHIDTDRKKLLLFSKIMYTKLLEEILKNEINLNVIIDKSNDSGIVYKNDIDKYIQMKSKDIIDNTMDKLKKHLLDFNNESEKFSLIDCINLSKRTIEKKHENYVDNETIKNNVKDIMSNIFEEKKDDAINISINMQDEMMKNIDKGF